MAKRDRNSLSYIKCTPSYFDLVDRNSGFYKSDMRGFYIMFTLISSGYIAITAYVKFVTKGILFEDSYLQKMLQDFFVVSLIWPGIFCYSWLAYFLQLLIIKGFPLKVANILQHFSQSLMFIAASHLTLARNWGLTQTSFATMLALVHFMKMHSYTMVNRDLRELALENPGKSEYPQNVNAKNFLIFMVTPALVYQTSYPKIPKFRLSYFLQKLVLLIVQLDMEYIIASDHILPIINMSNVLPLTEVFSRLVIPCLIFYIMIFLIIFEQILNLFAEMSLFGDREFYSDWWNSTTFEEFNRKWNRTVHLFLHKHVYLECLQRYQLSENTSKFITFFFSACCHEMVLALICRDIKPYLMLLMIFQIPVMLFQKYLNRTLFGLYFVWGSMMVGLPLLLSLYSKGL
ncbi:unnamed protein product [Blepharisma stoltei]|uniref:O-acyltransferase n=1 Tax=Blepharisma stoltei TaxID=1481888 RepID=A0AAU9IC33_9CILI|nr:unnamed protein product [Blepharisma stoltei]